MRFVIERHYHEHDGVVVVDADAGSHLNRRRGATALDARGNRRVSGGEDVGDEGDDALDPLLGPYVGIGKGDMLPIFSPSVGVILALPSFSTSSMRITACKGI